MPPVNPFLLSFVLHQKFEMALESFLQIEERNLIKLIIWINKLYRIDLIVINFPPLIDFSCAKKFDFFPI